MMSDKNDDTDDRLMCQECHYVGQREAQENIHKDQVIKANRLGHRIPLDGDKISKRGMWMTLTWDEMYCTKTDQPAMPKGIKHRCPLAKVSTTHDQEWWQ